jgi:hypothetical protein
VTHGLGTATHGNNSDGGKSVCNCYYVKVTMVSECEPCVTAIEKRIVLYLLIDENPKHRH